MKLIDYYQNFNQSKKNPTCPSCNQPIEKLPSRSGTCKHCKQKYYVRKDYETDKFIFTNEGGIKELSLKNRYFQWFNPYYQTTDISRFNQVQKDLIKKRDNWFSKFPEEGTYRDLIWSVLNERIYSSGKNRDYSSLSGLYMRMAKILHEEGKDNFQVLSESHKMHLLSIKETETSLRNTLSDEIKTRIKICNSAKDKSSLCENCKKIIDQEMSLDEAIKLNILPVKDCSCKVGYCDCFYIDLLTGL